MFAGVTARSNARRTVQRLDLDPRVVGERRQARRAGRPAGLLRRVALERRGVLDDVALNAEVVERCKFRAVELE